MLNWFAVAVAALMLALSSDAHAQGSVPGVERPPSNLDNRSLGGGLAPKPDGKPSAKSRLKSGGSEKSVDLADPDDPALRARLLNDLYVKLAKADSKDAAKQYARAIERLWSKSGSDTVDLLMTRSLYAVGKKKTDLAFELLAALTDLAPDYAEGWNRRAFLNFTLKKYDDALGDIQRVLALDPNHFKAIEGLYHLMRQYEDKASALKALRILKKVYPHWPGSANEGELAREVEGQPISFSR